MPPTEATIPQTEGIRAKKSAAIIANGTTTTSYGSNRRGSAIEEATVEDGKPPAGQPQLGCLGRLSYHVSIAIGQFFYR